MSMHGRVQSKCRLVDPIASYTGGQRLAKALAILLFAHMFLQIDAIGADLDRRSDDVTVLIDRACNPVGFRNGNPDDPIFDLKPIYSKDLMKNPEASVDILMKHVKSPYLQVRDSVIKRIATLDRIGDGKVNDERVVAALVDAVTPERTQVVVTALKGLEYLDSTLVDDEALAKIAEWIVKGEPRRVVTQACLTAGALGDKRFLPYLREAMQAPLAGKPIVHEWDHYNAAEIRRVARKVAARLGDATAAAEIRAQISGSDIEKQYEAIMDAAYARDKKAVKLIIAFLDREDGPRNPARDYFKYTSFQILACNALDMIVKGKELRWIDQSTTLKKARDRATAWKEWWEKNADKYPLPENFRDRVDELPHFESASNPAGGTNPK